MCGDRLVQSGHHLDGQDQVEILRRVILLRRRRRRSGTSRHVSGQPRSSTPLLVQSCAARRGRERLGDGGIDQQALGRVADAGPLALGVDARCAPPCRGRRSSRRRRDSCPCSASAPASALPRRRGGSGPRRRAGWPGRCIVQLQQMADGGAVGVVDELHRVGRQIARRQAVCRMRCRAVLECSASRPPRRMTALPLLTHRPAASTVTLGRDS